MANGTSPLEKLYKDLDYLRAQSQKQSADQNNNQRVKTVIDDNTTNLLLDINNTERQI